MVISRAEGTGEVMLKVVEWKGVKVQILDEVQIVVQGQWPAR